MTTVEEIIKELTHAGPKHFLHISKTMACQKKYRTAPLCVNAIKIPVPSDKCSF